MNNPTSLKPGVAGNASPSNTANQRISIACGARDNLEALLGPELVGMSLEGIAGALREIGINIPKNQKIFVNGIEKTGSYLTQPGDCVEIRQLAPEKA